ncbi:MAG TPA: NAD(P)H-hydrate dehydratase [Abditibacterium sp.]
MDFQKLDLELLKTMPLPDWGDDAHKGTRGKLLIVGGSARIPGAVILAARAALRAGCGSVRVAAPESVAIQIGIAVPELYVIPLPETKHGTVSEDALELIAEQSKKCQAMVLGPGIDENDKTDDVAREIVASAPLPMVVDAQALTALGSKLKFGEAPRVLTPHQAEFEALSGEKVGEDRAQTASDFAAKHGVVLALKGRESIIAAKGEPPVQNEAGSRALGTAGSGDVLAGIIGSFLAQGLGAREAAIWGVHLHALAGEAVTKDGGEDGILARDFIEQLPGIQKYLRRATGADKKTGFGLRR